MNVVEQSNAIASRPATDLYQNKLESSFSHVRWRVMAGKRQHIIPQFLQRGFASTVRDDEMFVFMHRKGYDGKEINIKHVAVEKHFYGLPGESSLDAKITKFEDQYAPFVHELRSTLPDGPLNDERTPRLINHLCLRTRSLRTWAQDSLVFLMNRVHDCLRQPDFLRKVACSSSART